MDLLFFDSETFSEVDIKTAGTVKYAKNAEMILGGFELNGQYDYYDYSLENKCAIPAFAYAHILDGGPVVAHNALFDYLVLKQYIPSLSLSQMRDSMAVVAAHGLPLSLAKAGAALGMNIQKYDGGSTLVRRFCIPRKPSKRDSRTRIHAHDDPEKWAEFRDKYLKDDVLAMKEIVNALGLLSDQEQQYWVDTQIINLHGIPIDAERVKYILERLDDLVNEESSNYIRITGHFPTQRNVALGWVRENGCKVLNLQAATVEAVLADPKTPEIVRTALGHRANTGHMSFKKFPVMLAALDEGAVRGTLLYHASHTGRFGGRLLQPQNLTKGDVDGNEAVERIDNGEFTVELVKSAVRPMIHHPDGFTIVDYAGIEARIVQWLVGDEDAIEVFNSGRDPYIEMAVKVYGVPYEIVSDKQRFMGKQAVLGLAYAMSAAKFKSTVESYGEEITMEEAQKVVEIYRKLHRKLVKFWKEINQGAIMSMQRDGEEIRVNKYISFFYTQNGFLEMRLPSGRAIKYPAPRLGMGEYGKELTYKGVNNQGQFVTTKTYGGKLVENAVQGISRDILTHAVESLLNNGYNIVTHIHDEIVVQGTHEPEYIASIMCDTPDWAEGAPITATGFNSPRYIKG